MGYLDRELRRGLNRALGTIIEDQVVSAVAPEAKKNLERNSQALGQAAASMARAVEDCSEEAAKKLKLCPECGKTSNADGFFCSECGAGLPEETLYDQMQANQPNCPGCGAAVGEDVKF